MHSLVDVFVADILKTGWYMAIHGTKIEKIRMQLIARKHSASHDSYCKKILCVMTYNAKYVQECIV